MNKFNSQKHEVVLSKKPAGKMPPMKMGTTQVQPTNQLKEIPTVRAFKATEFLYDNLLGEGAFGKVRKCHYLGKTEKKEAEGDG